MSTAPAPAASPSTPHTPSPTALRLLRDAAALAGRTEGLHIDDLILAAALDCWPRPTPDDFAMVFGLVEVQARARGCSERDALLAAAEVAS